MTALRRADGSIQGYVKVFRDATDRRMAEELAARQSEELERRVRERTAELEGFTYSVSHDMRTPLRGIASNARILLEDHGEGLDDPARQRLLALADAATKMGRLVDDLLVFARLGHQALNLREVDLSELVEEAAAILRKTDDCEVELEVQPDVVATADRDLIRMAILNLVQNSCKYRKPGELARVTFGTTPSPRGTAYFFRDQGIGFDMRYVHKIFEPFERLHRDSDYPGTGIGLANVRRIVTRHGGELWAEAEPGVGATFYFTLGHA